ncbi:MULTISPECIES: S8 family serine peptidase [Lysobacter]|uniref:S8 family serine peptidase n=1 Tax=Lysobacter TaxID=68 RepID=UPI000A728BB8|nr:MULTISPECIES: S8 family serine peptidase [Lysobacter]
MSTVSNNGIRMNVLATATVLALSALAAPAFAGQAHLGGLKQGGEYGQFIVKYRDGSAPRTSTTALSSSLSKAVARIEASRAGGKKFGLQHFRRMALGADVVRADRKLGRIEAEALMRQIAADPNVVSIEPDLPMRLLMQPNDTRYNEQWHYANSAVGANVAAAWDSSNGNGVVVAVVDSGILAHTDLSANILPGYDMVTSAVGYSAAECATVGATAGCGRSDDGDGRDANATDSSNIKHGTHVAGTIAALTNNAAGVAGVAYGAKVVPIRSMGKDGLGATSDIVDGILWAAGIAVPGVPANANPAEVINLSLGGDQPCSETPSYQDAIDRATAAGAIVVAAAGNSNINVSGATPASCNNVVTVAASDLGGNRAFYSSYGAGIDITAPGGETCSPLAEFLPLGQAPSCARSHDNQGVLSTVNGNGYGFMQGTSMATPHVAGVVALMQAVAPVPKTTAQVLAILGQTARPITAAKCPGGCGPGLIDAAAAVLAAQGGVGGNVKPVANFSSAVNGLTATFTDSSTDSDGNIVSRSWNFGDGTAASTATNPSHAYAAAGTYNVSLTVTDNAGGTHTKTASVTVTAPGGGVQTYSNTADYAITDLNTTESPITVSGRSGNAPSNATVTVAIEHSFRGDVRVDLVAPDGSTYLLKNYNTSDSANDIRGTVTLNLSTETLNGTWKLRARDNYANDTGKIDSWSIKF